MSFRGREEIAAEADGRRWIRFRVALLGGAFLALLGGVLARAAYLQIWNGQKLRSLAEDQYVRRVKIPAHRGDILDRNGVPLAQSVPVESIWIDPSRLKHPTAAAKRLANALGTDAKSISDGWGPDRHFEWVMRHVRPDQVAKVKALDIPGVGFTREPERFYPQRDLAGQVIGIVGTDGKGLAGLEYALDDDLTGRPQTVPSLRDARGRKSLVKGDVRNLGREGDTVTLTLDRQIQYATEQALDSAVTDSRAKDGMAVVLDPRTGELLALANAPAFNPNIPSEASPEDLRDRAALDAYEPGSTFKAFTVSAALAEGAVTPDTLIDCEEGAYTIGHHVIHDTHRHGELTPGQILQVSSNIGAGKIAAALGREKFFRYVHAFGFGQRTGLSLPGEAKGSVPYPRSDIRLATQAFGQGLSVTAVQLAMAYGAIANGGVLMRPILVKQVVAPDGTVVVDNRPTKVRRVISPKVARTVISMLEGVVTRKGTAPRAHMDDYQVAGKTGTAQKPDPVSGGYSDKRIASFVGMVPAENPRLVILVVIDEPQTDIYGGVVAAPAFKQIARFALPYLGVPPSHPVPLAVGRQGGGHSRWRPAERPAPARAPQSDVQFTAVTEQEATGTVQVPNLSGKVGREAVSELLSVALLPRIVGSGRVISQTPPPGARAERGSQVTLTLGAPP